MRLFTAVKLTERAKLLFFRKVNLIKDEINEDLKWVEPVNWHITLNFLGEINSDRIENIKDVMERSVAEGHQFTLQFNGVGAFPHLDRPRVIYVGIKKGAETLSRFYHNLNEGLITNGVMKEKTGNREYSPHITLARSRKGTNLRQVSHGLRKFTDKNFFINIYTTVDRISLIKSELHPEGPVYKEIFSVFLK